MEILFYVGMIIFGFYCLVNEDIEDVKNLIIRSNYSGRQVYLKDVAEVTEGYQKAKVLTKTNGDLSINLVVRAQAKADIIDLSDDIKTTIDELKKYLDTMNFYKNLKSVCNFKH